jgi:cold shock CspA family protein
MDINRLTVGDRVSFQKSVNKKGPCAVKIMARSGQ